ncbi:N-acetylmuramoyl-L-alanine amidase [Streptomyces sp. NBC_01497]|uniref:N-acetylmuramoyl-L-alanine amidase n=1 Tax=Streptomyces sp. NBC_01497 TaxID=2903885 RepID=UPI003FCE9820
MPLHRNPPAQQFPARRPHLSALRRRGGPFAARRRLRAAGPVLAVAALMSCALTGCQGSGGPVHAVGTGGAAAPGSATPATGHSSSATPGAPSTGAAKAEPLAGKVVAIDPGHNPHNYQHAAEINKQVKVGNGSKECDTTGTSTDAGYSEADFNLDVAHRLRALLQAQGAKVVLTYDDDRPWGPCVTERAETGNKAKADVALSIHADGAPVGRRGFHVILPGLVDQGGADNAKILAPSRRLGEDLRDAFQRETGTARSNYIGQGTGLDTRTDLGGLNLSTVPKVFIECGNMRDPKDAALVTSAKWRQRAALGMAEGIDRYLE